MFQAFTVSLIPWSELQFLGEDWGSYMHFSYVTAITLFYCGCDTL